MLSHAPGSHDVIQLLKLQGPLAAGELEAAEPLSPCFTERSREGRRSLQHRTRRQAGRQPHGLTSASAICSSTKELTLKKRKKKRQMNCSSYFSFCYCETILIHDYFRGERIFIWCTFQKRYSYCGRHCIAQGVAKRAPLTCTALPLKMSQLPRHQHQGFQCMEQLTIEPWSKVKIKRRDAQKWVMGTAGVMYRSYAVTVR